MSNAQWDLVYARIAALAEQHATTLVFVNTRRMAERAARHLGELLGKDHVAAHHGSLALGDATTPGAARLTQLQAKLKSGAYTCAFPEVQHDPALRNRLGQNGHEALHQHFSIGPCERATARHYRGLAPGTTPIAPSRGLMVVISTHNNAPDIAHLLQRVRTLVNAPVLVVDNRSTDATCHLAEQHGARVLRPLLAMTPWGSLQTGIRHALAQGYASVVTIDAEGRYEVEELPRLLAAGEDGDSDSDMVAAYFTARNSLPRRTSAETRLCRHSRQMC